MPKADTTQFNVDGFRSLKKFKVELTAGLNVLVGPNGSGKTNFIDFLSFLQNLFTGGATSTVARSGGVGRVFGFEKIRFKRPKMVAEISGVAISANSRKPNERMQFKYKYHLELIFDSSLSLVYIKRERLEFSPLSEESANDPDLGLASAIEIVRGDPHDPDSWVLKSSGAALENSINNPMHFRRSPIVPTTKEPMKLQDLLGPAISKADLSILYNRYQVRAFESVWRSITEGRSLNINPLVVRAPEDISALPGIGPGGNGLCSTFYQFLQASIPRPREPTGLSPNPNRNNMAMIVEWTKNVLPDIKEILVKPDPVTGKFQGTLVLGEKVETRIPFSYLSDGVLKWLVLACLVASSDSSFAVEEPENFLHPAMQRYFIDLLRENMEIASRNERWIISTHSETLINCCKPSELLIFQFMEGQTRATRVVNPQRVLEEVNKTGFGLGYFYVSNAIS